MNPITDENRAPPARIEPDEQQRDLQVGLPPKKRRVTFHPELLLVGGINQATTPNKPVKRLCVRMHHDLNKILHYVGSNDARIVANALEELYILLEEETKHDDTTKALYRACGHVDIRRASKRHPYSLTVQYWGLNVLGSLSYSKRLTGIDFAEEAALKQSIISVGVFAQARTAMEVFPHEPELAGVVLGVLNNFFDLYTFSELFDFGFMALVLDKLHRFPRNPNVQYPAAEALLAAAKAPNAARSKLQRFNAVSALARVLERYSEDRSKDGVWVYEKADAAMQAILSLKL